MQVQRRRRPAGNGGRGRLAKAGVATVTLVFTGASIGSASTRPLRHPAGRPDHQQGRGDLERPVPQPDRHPAGHPAGQDHVLDGQPDGTHLAALVADGGGPSWSSSTCAATRSSRSSATTPAANLQISGNDVGQGAPTYSPAASPLWIGRTDGYTKFAVDANGFVSAPVDVAIPAERVPCTRCRARRASPPTAPPSTRRSTARTRVVAINAATGAIEQSWNTGNAPRALIRFGTKLYVTNEGGRTAVPGDTTLNSYGTQVPASPVTGSTTTGTVSVIDIANPAAPGRQHRRRSAPDRAVHLGPDAVAANTNSNTVSVIDTKQGPGRPDDHDRAVAGGHGRLRADRDGA